MKIVFIEINGVLLNKKCLVDINDGKKTRLNFNNNACSQLNHIDQFVPGPLGLVVICSWRNEYPLEDLKWIFINNNIQPPVVGAVSRSNIGRSLLINDWILSYEYTLDSYVILTSDNHDIASEHRLTRTVLCDLKTGLNKQKAEKTIKILNQ